MNLLHQNICLQGDVTQCETLEHTIHFVGDVDKMILETVVQSSCH